MLLLLGPHCADMPLLCRQHQHLCWRAAAHVCRLYLLRYFVAWNEAATALHVRSSQLALICEGHWWGVCVGKAWHGWSTQVQAGKARRAALRRVFASQAAADRQVSLCTLRTAGGTPANLHLCLC
jgi:hypothetical protein